MPQWLLLNPGITLGMDPVLLPTQDMPLLIPTEAHKVSVKGPLNPNPHTDTTANTPGLQPLDTDSPPPVSVAVENDPLNPPATNTPTPELEASPKSVLLTFSPTLSDP